jgi:hypothetical protein
MEIEKIKTELKKIESEMMDLVDILFSDHDNQKLICYNIGIIFEKICRLKNYVDELSSKKECNNSSEDVKLTWEDLQP